MCFAPKNASDYSTLLDDEFSSLYSATSSYDYDELHEFVVWDAFGRGWRSFDGGLLEN